MGSVYICMQIGGCWVHFASYKRNTDTDLNEALHIIVMVMR